MLPVFTLFPGMFSSLKSLPEGRRLLCCLCSRRGQGARRPRCCQLGLWWKLRLRLPLSHSHLFGCGWPNDRILFPPDLVVEVFI